MYAAREVKRDYPSMYVVVSYVPFLRNVGELKTKPTQHAISELRATGINPDILITRSEIGLDDPRRETLARRCFLDDDAIFDDPDAGSIYDVPLVLEKQGILKKVCKVFRLKSRKVDLKRWRKIVKREKKGLVRVALVGKYVNHGKGKHADVYVSVLEALKHGAIANGIDLEVDSIDSNNLDEKALKKYAGIVVPQGWGSRGVSELEMAFVHLDRPDLATSASEFLGFVLGANELFSAVLTRMRQGESPSEIKRQIEEE